MKSRARVGLAAALQHAVADTNHPLHPLELFRREWFVDALGGEIKIQRFGQQRQSNP
jgi:hypothetical protein